MTNKGFTSEKEYLTIIENSQIISLDLVINDSQGNILLGKRTEEVAKGMWFVPGGRMRKNEMFKDACKRITNQELGYEIVYTRELGVYHQLYPNNYKNHDFSSHYITFAVGFSWENNLLIKHDNQHEELKWWSISDLLASEDVHEYTKNYFIPYAWNRTF